MTEPDRRIALPLAVLAALVTATGSACAAGDTAPADAAGFPASAQEHDVLPWLAAHTSARARDVIVITPQAVVVLDSTSPAADQPNLVDASVREELIDAALAGRLHARSARIDVQADCTTGLYRIRQSTRFALPDLKGDAISTPPPAAIWTQPEAGTPMLGVVHAACAHGAAPPAAPAATPTPPPPPPPTPVQSKIATASPPAAPAAPVQPPPAQTRVAAAPTSKPAPAGPAFEVHLGSYSTEANARSAIAQLTRGHAGPMQGHDAVVRKIPVGGRDLYLVAVEGFPERADAAAFCKAVHAAPADCLIRR